MRPPTPSIRRVLALTLVPNLGPVRIARLIQAFGSAYAIHRASPDQLQRVRGIGPKIARSIPGSLRDVAGLVDDPSQAAPVLRGIKLVEQAVECSQAGTLGGAQIVGIPWVWRAATWTK